jgi:hypothetical protein
MATSLKTASDSVPRDTVKWTMLMDIIRRVHVMYQDIDIKAALRYSGKSSTYYKVFVTGRGSGYCGNYRKDHRSARIYFIVKRSGAIQKCWCKCDTTEGRSSGKRCRDYESPGAALASHECAMLFESTSSLIGMVPPSTSASLDMTSFQLDTFIDKSGEVSALTTNATGSMFIKTLKRKCPGLNGGSTFHLRPTMRVVSSVQSDELTEDLDVDRFLAAAVADDDLE